MGVDAEMFLKTRASLSDEDIRFLAYRLAEAVGHTNFWISTKPDFGPPHHCLAKIEAYQQDGPTINPEDSETLLRVYLWGRYYGPGYERGNPFTYVAVAEWLERNVEDAEVWYGGDSSGIWAKRFGPEQREALIAHWAKNGHLPYTRGFDYDIDDAVDRPICPTCHVPMMRYGWGQKYAAVRCDGCGYRLASRDDGATWKPPEKGGDP